MKHHFFWGGPLSNWYPAMFKWQDQQFICTEQYMMYYKALVFGDRDIATQVLMATEPKAQKALGRKIKNFDVDIWSSVSYTIVFGGCLAKFNQNPSLAEYLLNTGDDILVEASPYDRIWGIGYSAEDAPNVSVDKWGENRLGKVLMDVRTVLR